MNDDIAITTADVGVQVCTILGIDPTNVSCVTFEFMPGETIYVNVSRYITVPELDRILQSIQPYQLVAQDQPTLKE